VAVFLNFHNVELEPGTPEMEIGMDRYRAKQKREKVVRSPKHLDQNHFRTYRYHCRCRFNRFVTKDKADGPFNLLRPEDTTGADYPTGCEDSEGRSVLVVNSDLYYRYVGNLMATFDKYENIIEVDDRVGPIATTAEAIGAFEDVLGMQLSPHDDVASTPFILAGFTWVRKGTARHSRKR
jgi:hypothetical protein